MDISLFVPCFIDQLYPQTAINVVKVLRKLGCNVHYPLNQTCCGQPAFNAGYWKESKTVAEKFVQDFKNENTIVSPSGSCVGFVRNYYKDIVTDKNLLEQYKNIKVNTFEFAEFVAKNFDTTKLGAKLVCKATYHDACGSLHECDIKQAPRQLLQNVEGLELIEMEEAETCCGFGGTFAVKFEPISIAMAEQKVNHALETKADYIISADYSCLLHLDAYIQKNKLPIKVMHLADALASGW